MPASSAGSASGRLRVSVGPVPATELPERSPVKQAARRPSTLLRQLAPPGPLQLSDADVSRFRPHNTRVPLLSPLYDFGDASVSAADPGPALLAGQSRTRPAAVDGGGGGCAGAGRRGDAAASAGAALQKPLALRRRPGSGGSARLAPLLRQLPSEC